MLDLKKFNSEFDLKNLDIPQLIKIMNERKNSLTKGALIVITLIMTGAFFNDYHAKDQALHAQMSEVQKKIDSIKARDAAIAQLNDFRTALPKRVSEFDLIKLVSRYAILHHVTITSLSPAESKDMGLYDVITVGFKAESSDFKSMIMFLRDIEKSKYPLRVDSWLGGRETGGGLGVSIDVSAILINK